MNFIKFFSASCSFFCSFFLMAEGVPTIYDSIPSKGKYEFFKSNSYGVNLDVINLYESNKTGKILVACLNGAYIFYMKADWDLPIRSEADAKSYADKSCKEFEGRILVGYGMYATRRY
jgi:hypothetical protein